MPTVTVNPHTTADYRPTYALDTPPHPVGDMYTVLFLEDGTARVEDFTTAENRTRSEDIGTRVVAAVEIPATFTLDVVSGYELVTRVEKDGLTNSIVTVIGQDTPNPANDPDALYRRMTCLLGLVKLHVSHTVLALEGV